MHADIPTRAHWSALQLMSSASDHFRFEGRMHSYYDVEGEPTTLLFVVVIDVRYHLLSLRPV